VVLDEEVENKTDVSCFVLAFGCYFEDSFFIASAIGRSYLIEQLMNIARQSIKANYY